MRRVLRDPAEAVLVVAAFWQPALTGEAAGAAVSGAFGELEDASPVFALTQTDYYRKEMGEGLFKRFFAINGLQPRDSLVSHKLAATALEDRFLGPDGRRALNVDPMLVSLENVVVATSKSFPHRVYLGRGVFGDLQLLRRRSGFDALPWTYRDYAEQLAFFEGVHARLRASARP